MDSMDMDASMDYDYAPQQIIPPGNAQQEEEEASQLPMPSTSAFADAPTTFVSSRDTLKEVAVKVHKRRAEQDTWTYIGKAVCTHEEEPGHKSRVVVRSVATGKEMVVFNESKDLQAEKRGNFVVIGTVEDGRVQTWSLNALNNSSTLRLMTYIELASYRAKAAREDPKTYNKSRRRIERLIKDDRRRRHRRRRDADALVDAFAKSDLNGHAEAEAAQSTMYAPPNPPMYPTTTSAPVPPTS